MARKKRVGREESRAYWMMVLPALIIYLLVMAFPIVLSMVLSVSNYNGGKMFGGESWAITGFAKYGKLFNDPLFWIAASVGKLSPLRALGLITVGSGVVSVAALILLLAIRLVL